MSRSIPACCRSTALARRARRSRRSAASSVSPSKLQYVTWMRGSSRPTAARSIPSFHAQTSRLPRAGRHRVHPRDALGGGDVVAPFIAADVHGAAGREGPLHLCVQLLRQRETPGRRRVELARTRADAIDPLRAVLRLEQGEGGSHVPGGVDLGHDRDAPLRRVGGDRACLRGAQERAMGHTARVDTVVEIGVREGLAEDLALDPDVLVIGEVQVQEAPAVVVEQVDVPLDQRHGVVGAGDVEHHACLGTRAFRGFRADGRGRRAALFCGVRTGAGEDRVLPGCGTGRRRADCGDGRARTSGQAPSPRPGRACTSSCRRTGTAKLR